MGEKKKKYQTNHINTGSVSGIVTAAWVYLMFTLFPLIYHDYYYDILETKTYTFMALTGAMIIAMVLWLIVGGELGKTFRKTEPFGFSVTDWSMLIFWAVAGISTLAAGRYMAQALWGTEGRYVGFFFISLVTAAYFLVTRYLKFSKHMIAAFLCTEILLCLFGITDFYCMNLLHFKDRMINDQDKIFFSTIGNINSYTVMVGFGVVLSGVLFILSMESTARTAFYFAAMLIALTALTMGSSDNGYLTLAAFFGLVPFVAFRSFRSAGRYFLTLAVYFSNILRIWHVEQVRTEKELPFVKIDGLFNIIARLSFLPIMIAVLWGIAAVLIFADIKKKENKQLLKVMRILWLVLCIAAVGGVIALFVKANSMSAKEASEKFGSLEHYLYFDNDWGNQRGYVWRVCIEEFGALSLPYKLIGTGPDSFSVQMFLHRYKEMRETTGQIYDSAHNEFLQYLYTVGIIGLISYIGQLAGGVRSAFRAALKTEPGGGKREAYYAAYYWAVGFVIIAYAMQSTVNINIPVASPLLWVFIMLAETAARELKQEKQV